MVDILQDSLGNGAKGHSVTWQPIKAICATCQTAFEGRAAIVDGIEAYRPENCPECAAELLAQERRQVAQDKLADACEKELQVWMRECGCPFDLLTKSFSNFDAKAQPRAFKVISGYDFREGKSIILASQDYGIGKTHLAAAAVNRILREISPARLVYDYYVQTVRCPVYFTTEPRMLDRIRATFNDGHTETEEQVYRRLETVPLLIIDDVGKLKPRDPNFLQGVYFRIMDTRSTNKRPIIMTTNLTLEELEQHLGGATADRLRGMCGPDNIIIMKGHSYRRR